MISRGILKTQGGVLLSLVIICLLIGGPEARAQKLLDVPADLPNAAAFKQERKMIIEEFERLKGANTNHLAQCEGAAGTPREPGCDRKQTRLLNELSDYLNLVKEFNRGLKIAKAQTAPSPKAALLLDALEAGKGDWGKSVRELGAQLKLDPKNVAIRDALSYLKGVHKGHMALSELGNVRYKMGVHAWMEGKYKDAQLHFGEAYEIDPRDVGALNAFGYVSGLAQSEDNDKALGGCYLDDKCDPLSYVKSFEAQTSYPAQYRLLDTKERKQLYDLRIDVRRNPGKLEKRAALQFVEGLAAWDDFKDRSKDEASKVNDVGAMARGLTQIGRGRYREAVSTFARGLDEDWAGDALIFSFFHAMGQNEGTRTNPKASPRLWDDRTKEIYNELWETELKAITKLVFTDPNAPPPWKAVHRKLRNEEVKAWSNFLTAPFETGAKVLNR